MKKYLVVVCALVGCSNSNDPASLAVVTSAGDAVAAVSFPPTTAGQNAAEMLLVQNEGGASTGTLSLGVTGAFVIADTTTCGASLAPGSQCTVDLFFAPTVAGAQSGVFTLAGDPGGAVTVALTGTSVEPMITLTPDPAEFGVVSAGASATTTITVANTATLDSSFDGAVVTGTGFSKASTTCGATIAASASCTVDVVFAPTDVGDATGTLVVTVDGVAHTVQLHGDGASNVTVVLAGSGTGTVTSDPAGITCGTSCSADFSGSLTLTAVADSDSLFVGWSDASCTTSVCALPASNAARTLTATFTKAALLVTPISSDLGLVEIGQHVDTSVHVVNTGTAALALTLASSGSGFSKLSATCPATLAAGAACDVVERFAPASLGASNGTLDVSAPGETHPISFTGAGAHRVSVVMTGLGSGVVTSSVPGVDCTQNAGTCSGLFTTTLVLDAVADTGSTFNGWSDSSCGAMCTIAASTTPVTISVDFTSMNAKQLTLTFAGTGAGRVTARVFGTALSTSCTSSCTIPLPANATIILTADTADGWGGFTGICTATAPVAQCQFTAADASATATFSADPKEAWTFLSDEGAPFTSAAFDTHDGVVVTSTLGVTKFDSTGEVSWSVGIAADAVATGSADQVYVRSGSSVVALDTNGIQLWTHTVGTSCSSTLARPLAVSVNGDIAIQTAAALTVLDAAGNVVWTKPVAGTLTCDVAIDSAGVVFTGVLDQPESISALRFAAANGASLSEMLNIGDETVGNFVIGPSDHVGASSSGHGTVLARAQSQAGAVDFNLSTSVVAGGAVWNSIARSAATYVRAFSSDEGLGFTMARLSTTGAATFTLVRPALRTADALDYGWAPSQVAGSTSGRLAIVGAYQTAGVPFGAVQVFLP